MHDTVSTMDKEFLMVVRQALLMIVCWIEKKYGLKGHNEEK